MDNLGDWFYLIIILGATLFSFIKKSFSKASEGNGRPSAESTTMPESPIPPIVFTPFGEDKRSEPKRRKEKKKTTPAPTSTHNKRPEFMASTPPKMELSPITIGEIGMEERNPLTPDLSDNESVRRAIIFAEVFEPKFSKQYR